MIFYSYFPVYKGMVYILFLRRYFLRKIYYIINILSEGRKEGGYEGGYEGRYEGGYEGRNDERVLVMNG